MQTKADQDAEIQRLLNDISGRSARWGRIGFFAAIFVLVGIGWGILLLTTAIEEYERFLDSDEVLVRFSNLEYDTPRFSLKKEVEGAATGEGMKNEEPDAARVLRLQFQRVLDNLGVIEAFEKLSNGNDWLRYAEERDGAVEFALDMAMLRTLDLVCFSETEFQSARRTQFGHELAVALNMSDEGDFEANCPETHSTEALATPSADGKELTISSGNFYTAGLIDAGVVENWYTLIVEEEDSYVIRTESPEYGTGLDTVVRLYDANGVTVGVDDDSGFETYSELRKDLALGIYYLGVAGYFESKGRYRLSVVDATTDERNRAAERRALRKEATALALGNGQSDTLDGIDVRIYEFVVNEGESRTYTISTSAPADGSTGVDTVVRMYRYESDREEPVGEDDDSGDDSYSRLLPHLEPGTYYIHVSSYWSLPGAFNILVE